MAGSSKKKQSEEKIPINEEAAKLLAVQKEAHHKAGVAPVMTVLNDVGDRVSIYGKPIGRPKKPSGLEARKLSKSQMRDIYNSAFDKYAVDIFTVLFTMAQSDKDLLKFVVEQRIGKAAQVIAGDEQSPLTVVVRRGALEMDTPL